MALKDLSSSDFNESEVGVSVGLFSIARVDIASGKIWDWHCGPI